MSKTRVLGLDQLDKNIDRLVSALDGAQLADVLVDNADDIFVEKMQARAPQRTRALSESIEATEVKHDKNTALAAIVASQFYGFFQELGTSKQAAKLFMRPVFDEREDAYVEAVAADLRKLVLRAVG